MVSLVTVFRWTPVRRCSSLTIIGGRGVGNWEGDQPNFGWEGVVFGPPGGETSFTFLRGERGGNKRQNRKIFLIAAKKKQNFGNFEQN